MGFWGDACNNKTCRNWDSAIGLNCPWECPEACEDYNNENESINSAGCTQESHGIKYLTNGVWGFSF